MKAISFINKIGIIIYIAAIIHGKTKIDYILRESNRLLIVYRNEGRGLE